MEEMKTEMKELRGDVKELLQRSAVHNQILQEHKNFSIALQNEQKIIKAQLDPLMKDHHLIATILKVAGAVMVAIIGKWVVGQLL
jgi:hypothetical protein